MAARPQFPTWMSCSVTANTSPGSAPSDVDRPREGMYRIEIERCHVAHLGFGRQLTVCRLLGVHFDHRTRGNPQHWRNRAAETVVCVLGRDDVVGRGHVSTVTGRRAPDDNVATEQDSGSGQNTGREVIGVLQGNEL